MSTYIGPENFLIFILLSSCVKYDNSHRNYLICLKFSTNVYVLCQISCIALGIHSLNGACTGIHKSILIHYNLWRKNVFVFFPVCMWCNINSRKYTICLELGTIVYMLCKISCTDFGVHCPNRMHTRICKISQYITVYSEEFCKISFDIIILHKI